MTVSQSIPLTVVGGYLGAGKTTLLNEILADPRGVRYAVVVNDIGEINVDAELLGSSVGDMVTLDNGCVCCEMVDGFGELLTELANPERGIDHVLVEVSGVGDPWKVAQWGRTPGFTLQAVLTLADVTTIQTQAVDRYVGETVVAQLRGADVVVLTKTDLAPEAPVREWVQSQTQAPVLTAKGGVRPILDLLSLVDAQPGSPRDHPPHLHHHVVTISPRQWARSAWQEWLATAPDAVVRAKGFVQNHDGGQFLLQRVGKRNELTRWKGPAAPDVIVVVSVEALDPDAWLSAAAADVGEELGGGGWGAGARRA